jgi:hypothetical protein
MSYLMLPDGIPDFNKAVISLWFRVPQKSIAAKIAASNVSSDPVMSIVIPFVTWGRPQIPNIDSDSTAIDDQGNGPPNPSYVGLQCDWLRDGLAYLAFHLQTDTFAVVTGGPIGPPSVMPGSEQEFYAVDTVYGNGRVPVTPDQWHHVLVSFDLSYGCSTVGPPATPIPGGDPPWGAGDFWLNDAEGTRINSRLWYAFDDVNYNGTFLGPYNIDGVGGDPNGILTRTASNTLSNLAGSPTCVVSAPNLPAYGAPLGLPAAPLYVNDIYKVELAEFLMFTGVSMDTGIEANRRLFITADGKPVNPTPTMTPLSKTTVGDPTTWEPGADASNFASSASAPGTGGSANKILGTPVVDFTRSSLNWTTGRNLGSAKGPVVKTGEIKAYFPDPMLGG